MTQAQRYVKLCIQGWTSHHKAVLMGCGNYPWKRWGEWSEKNRDWLYPNKFSFAGKCYREQTRVRTLKGVTFMERRLVRV